MSKAITKSSAKMSFQKEFFSDLFSQNMLYAVTIRSPVKKGSIVSISHPDMPEDYFLFTKDDIPGSNTFEYSDINESSNIFCDGKVSYLGEPVGLLVGPDERRLKEIQEELEIIFDDSTEEADDSSSDKNIKLAERNVFWGPCFTEDKDKYEAINSIFEASDIIEQNAWSYELSVPLYNEPNGALATWDGETLTVYTPTLWSKNLRSLISQALKISENAIVIKKTQGSSTLTNNIWYNSIIASQVSLAALKTGKPVKLIYSRAEQNSFMENTRPIIITHKTSCTKEGVIKAMQIDIEVDAGYTNPFSKEIVDRLVLSAAGCYAPENIFITASVLRSSNPPASIDMQKMDSATFYAIENQINLLCEKCQLTPLEIRLKNLRTEKKDFPFNIELEKSTESLNALARISDFNRKYSSYHQDSAFKDGVLYESSRESPARGIGFACGYESSCFLGSSVYDPAQSIEVTLEENESITIHTPPVSNSIEAIFTKIASKILDISASSIKINTEIEKKNESSLPENTYNTISILTILLKKCCETIKKRKEGTALPYTVKKKFNSSKKLWNAENFTGTPFYSSSFGCASIELELDTCTYREHIRNISVIINSGKLLNIQSAESAIKLSIQKVLSALVNGTQLSSDKLRISFVQSDREPSQIGELIFNILPAAYTQALTQALRCTINTLPLYTDTVFSKLQEKKIQALALKKAALEAAQKNEEEQNEDSSNSK